MKALLAASSAAIALACASSAAAATTVIDFDEYVWAQPGPYGEHTFTSMTTEGFKITNSFNSLWVRQANHIYNPDPGGANLYIPFAGMTRFERADGTLFNLDSLDFADASNGGVTGLTLQLTYSDGTDTFTRNLVYDAQRGFQTADLQLKNVKWFAFRDQTQIDNIVVRDISTGAVPEPATWAMMILGFGAAGAAVRRRRAVAATA